jgi:uncharacterized membrane protein
MIYKSKKFIFIAVNIFILIVIFHVFSSVHAIDSKNNIINSISFEGTPIFVLDEGIIQNDDMFLVPASKSLVIIDPTTNMQITLPNGTNVIDYSCCELEVVHQNFEIETINLTDSNKLFIPFNYGISLYGTQNFTFKIYFNENYTNYELDQYFIKYSIDWGNNKTTKGSQPFPSILTHDYHKQGTYNITMDLIDINGVKYSISKTCTFNLSTTQFLTYWAIENKEPIAIGTSGTIGTLLFLGIALTESGKYRILTLLALAFPMVIPTNKEDVLDQFVRGQIYGYIKTNPGTHYNQIMRELDIKNGTLSYHLYVLEKTGIVKSRKEHLRYRAFYPIDIKFPEEERYRLTDLQIKILELILSNKGTNQKYIAKILNEKHQTISYNIKVLEQSGLISVYKKGRKTHCQITNEALSTLTFLKSEKIVN